MIELELKPGWRDSRAELLTLNLLQDPTCIGGYGLKIGGGLVGDSSVKKQLSTCESVKALLPGWQGRGPRGKSAASLTAALGFHSPGSPRWHKSDGRAGCRRQSRTTVCVCERKGSCEHKAMTFLRPCSRARGSTGICSRHWPEALAGTAWKEPSFPLVPGGWAGSPHNNLCSYCTGRAFLGRKPTQKPLLLGGLGKT